MKRDEGGEIRPSREELEGSAFDDLSAGLTDMTITRSRAIKLAGAALAGSALTLLWPAEADARRRRRRRRRRRKVEAPGTVVLVPGENTVTVTNPGEKALTIENVTILDSNGE